MDQIKPIQTIYNGYRFRSRLEARWAVFFDKAEIPYIYEPEGFYLSSGAYLPDFYLPWFHAYVEIKPKALLEPGNEPLKKTAEDKLLELGDLTGELPVICFGDPMDDKMFVFCNASDEFSSETRWFSGAFYRGPWYSWGGSEGSDGRHWVSIGIRGAKTGVYWKFRRTNGESFCGIEWSHMIYCRDDFNDAKEAARQARFEHGESPIIKRSTFK